MTVGEPTRVCKESVNKVENNGVEYQHSYEDVVIDEELLDSINNYSGNDNNTNQDTIYKTVNVQTTSTSQNVYYTEFEMAAGSFNIILLINKKTSEGAFEKNEPILRLFKENPELKYEYRSLQVGDFIWIARPVTDGSQELVLPFVIERKTMEDLGASIKYGKFHEEKLTLRKCGLRNLVFLIENYGSNVDIGMPLQILMEELANTRDQDGFKVQTTDSLSNSAKFLAMMTKQLTIRFKNKDLKGSDYPKDDYLMIFKYFNNASDKSKALSQKHSSNYGYN